MAAKATTWHFCESSISLNLQGLKLYKCNLVQLKEGFKVFSTFFFFFYIDEDGSIIYYIRYVIGVSRDR